MRRGEDGWLDGIYADETLITQLDGRTRADDIDGDSTVVGSATSSSTLPSLVLRMWQQLEVASGHRVLEVGTGTGRSTALGAHRLGGDRLTSIEYDPAVGRAAASALAAAGYAPRLVIGDGLRGDPDASTGAHDRLIATCSVRYVPMAWLHQAPAAERMGAGPEQILWDVSTGSRARTVPGPDGGWTVVQRGPVRLWGRVEAAILLWQAAGEPHQEGFGITVSAAGQRVWIGGEDGPGWDLPV